MADRFSFLELSRSQKSRAKRISLFTNSEIAVNASVSPQLSPGDFFTKQEFGFNLGIFWPLGKKLFFKTNFGMHRELIQELDKTLNVNYQFFLVPKITF